MQARTPSASLDGHRASKGCLIIARVSLIFEPPPYRVGTDLFLTYGFLFVASPDINVRLHNYIYLQRHYCTMLLTRGLFVL